MAEDTGKRTGRRRLARWSLAVPGLLAALVAALWLYGRSLPREHRATVEVTLAAGPEAVWPLIAEPVGSERWRRGVERVEAAGLRDGQPLFREESGYGTLLFAHVESDPPRRLVVELVDPTDFGGEWVFELAPEGSGTRVTITERGWIVSPFFRVLAVHAFGLDATLARYAADLQAEVARQSRA